VALNRAKVIEVAQKHLAKGNFERAIAENRKLVEDDPRDVRTLLKIGDIYTRQGSRPEAVRTYEQVAEHYASQGFFLKAVAVCKQILKLEPGRIEVSLKLGQMYEELQLVSDALTTYELVAQTFARAGNMDRALDTLGRMAALDAENIPVRIKYAEALSKAGRTEDAADEFAAGAALLEQQGRIEDYLKVSERLLYHRPADLDLARKLSSVYLERNDAKRALAKLQLAFKANSKDVRTLELLAQAFRLLGQTPKTSASTARSPASTARASVRRSVPSTSSASSSSIRRTPRRARPWPDMRPGRRRVRSRSTWRCRPEPSWAPRPGVRPSPNRRCSKTTSSFSTTTTT